jgi:hypothetical protein
VIMAKISHDQSLLGSTLRSAFDAYSYCFQAVVAGNYLGSIVDTFPCSYSIIHPSLGEGKASYGQPID